MNDRSRLDAAAPIIAKQLASLSGGGPLDPSTPAPVVGSGGVVGPLSREEVLTLKLAEHVLCRGQLTLAVASLLRGARKAGKSGVQKLVLAADLEELDRRMKQADGIKWPNTQDQPRGAKTSEQ